MYNAADSRLISPEIFAGAYLSTLPSNSHLGARLRIRRQPENAAVHVLQVDGVVRLDPEVGEVRGAIDHAHRADAHAQAAAGSRRAALSSVFTVWMGAGALPERAQYLADVGGLVRRNDQARVRRIGRDGRDAQLLRLRGIFDAGNPQPVPADEFLPQRVVDGVQLCDIDVSGDRRWRSAPRA